MKITMIDIDLAKEVFQIHGVNKHGKTVLCNRLRRGEMTKYFVNLEPYLMAGKPAVAYPTGRESWANLDILSKLMSPQFVKLYVRTNKHV